MPTTHLCRSDDRSASVALGIFDNVSYRGLNTCVRLLAPSHRVENEWKAYVFLEMRVVKCLPYARSRPNALKGLSKWQPFMFKTLRPRNASQDVRLAGQVSGLCVWKQNTVDIVVKTR